MMSNTHGRRCIPGVPAVRSAKGFTLLELLVAVTVLMMTVVLAAGALRLGYSAVDRGDRKMDSLDRARTAVTVMEAQIRSIVPRTFDAGPDRKIAFAGSGRTLQFATDWPVAGAGRGHVIASWRVEEKAGGREDLVVDETTPGLAVTRQTRLLEDVDWIRFEFLVRDITGEMAWSDEWKPETSVPDRVRVSLASGGRAMTILIPVRAR
jgi:type II secretory pathway component PulJ